MEVPMAVNQRWSIEFVADQMANGRRFRILKIVDEYSREVRSQLLSKSISGQKVAGLLDFVEESRD